MSNIETKKQILNDIFNFVNYHIKKTNKNYEKSFDNNNNIKDIHMIILEILLNIFDKSNEYDLDKILVYLKDYTRKFNRSNEIIDNPMVTLNKYLQTKLTENNSIYGSDAQNYKIIYYDNLLESSKYQHDSFDYLLEQFYVKYIKKIDEELLNYFKDIKKRKYLNNNLLTSKLYNYITDKDCEYYKNIKEQQNNNSFDFMHDATARRAAAAAEVERARAAVLVELLGQAESRPPPPTGRKTQHEHEPEAVAFTHLRANLSGPKERQVFMDNHPDKLFRTFKTNIQTVSSSSQDIKKLFDNTAQGFEDISNRLQETKLSKKEKIKILFLCGFELTNHIDQRGLNIIKTDMLNENYFEILKNYLYNNQHMIANGMFYSALDNPPTENIKKKEIEDIQLIKKNENLFISVTYGHVKHEIPLETQVIYLLHNVIMD